MNIEISGKNFEVTEGIREAVANSLTPLEKYFANKEIDAKVVVKTYKVGQKIEVSLVINHGNVIRQEVMAEDLYAAIAQVGKKLDKQIKKMNSRLKINKKHGEEIIPFLVEYDNGAESHKTITRRKTIDNKPMSEDEAILQFEISGHDFYIFNDYLDGDITKVLYKRKDGEYGVIELV